MLKITNTRIHGLETSIIASGYPMATQSLNSKEFMYRELILKEFLYTDNDVYRIPTNEEIKKLLQKEALIEFAKEANIKDLEVYINNSIKRIKALGTVPTGTGHDNFAKGIHVEFDVCYPGYWSAQFQRYHFADIVSSMSKMHRLCKMDITQSCNKYVDKIVIDNLNYWISIYNKMKNCDFYVSLKKTISDKEIDYHTIDEQELNNKLSKGAVIVERLSKYEVYMKIISNCPMGFEMTMRVTTSYLQLKTIYLQRKNHKLKEDWKAFCDWCESLPLFKEICLKEER